MYRAVRVIVYEFENEQDMAEQLGRSMNEGCKVLPTGTISVANVPDALLFALGKAISVIEETLGQNNQPD